MSASMEDPATSSPRGSTSTSRARLHACDILDECVEEFTRRLQASVALPEDDERFWERVRADIRALRSRCQPQDAFAFQLKAARVLADFGFTACPSGVMAPPVPTPREAPVPRPFTIDHGQPTTDGTGTRAA